MVYRNYFTIYSMKNPRAAGAYVFSQIVDSLWIAKTTLTSYQKRRGGGKIDDTWQLTPE